VALAVLSGFAEELFFRGAVQGAFGWLPATLAFAVLHSGPGKAFRLWILFAAIAGSFLQASPCGVAIFLRPSSGTFWSTP